MSTVVDKSPTWANAFFVDDASTSGARNYFTYSGNDWWHSSNVTRDRAAAGWALDSLSTLSSRTGSDSFTLTFYGTGAAIMGTISAGTIGGVCQYSVSIDNGPMESVAVPSGMRTIYNITSLRNGPHTLRLTDTHELSVQVDYAAIIVGGDIDTSPEDEDDIHMITASSPNVKYQGFETQTSIQGEYQSMFTSNNGDSAQLEFTGRSLHVLGSWGDQLYTSPSGNITLSIAIDSAPPETRVIPVIPGFTLQDVWLDMTFDDLDAGDHTFELTVADIHPTEQVFTISHFLYADTPQFVIRTSDESEITSSTRTSSRPTSTGFPSSDGYEYRQAWPVHRIIIVVCIGLFCVGGLISCCVWWKNRRSKRMLYYQTQLPPGPVYPMPMQHVQQPGNTDSHQHLYQAGPEFNAGPGPYTYTAPPGEGTSHQYFAPYEAPRSQPT